MLISSVWLSSVLVMLGQGGAVYLSDCPERILYHQQAWGQLGLDTAVKPADGRPARPLQIRDALFEKGLGMHANGEIAVLLDGAYAAFEASVGVQNQQNGAGSVIFQVFVDDEKKFDSGVMRETDPARPVKVSLDGADMLRLVVSDAGDGITCDCANWAEAKLFRSGIEQRPADFCDMAPFATVCVSDPNRMEGTKASRVQEFPAEDVFLERPAKIDNGRYVVVPGADGKAAIGLRWAEYRMVRSLALHLGPDTPAIDPADVEVQYWTGESPWQGTWRRLVSLQPGNPSGAKEIGVDIDRKLNPDWPKNGVDKVRWVFSNLRAPLNVARLEARTQARWQHARLRLESDGPAEKTVIEAYNGEIGTDGRTVEWASARPISLDVQYTKPRPWKSDRTMLRITRGGRGCAIAVEDVLQRGPVHVPAMGVYAVVADSPMTTDGYKQSIASRKTILEQVREMPDQTFDRAMQAVHNPVQDLGPTLLSAGCNAWKVIVHRDGVIQLELTGKSPDTETNRCDPSCRITPTFGSGKSGDIERRLPRGGVPVPETAVRDGKVVYRQLTLVGTRETPNGVMTTGPSYCMAKFDIQNEDDRPAEASLAFSATGMPVNAALKDGAVVFGTDEKEYVVISGDVAPLEWEFANNTARLAGTLSARGTVTLLLVTPPQDASSLVLDEHLEWLRALANGAEIDIPDESIRNIILASQAHCLVAARPGDAGATIAAWIASDRYGPLESEAHSIILGMDMMGHHEFARRALEYFIRRYSPEGYLTTGYTLMGTGWHLWTLARHVELTGDLEWFKGVAPEVARVCRWVAAQCGKTKDPAAPESGLFPPGVGADWNRYAYRFAVQAHYSAGLRDAAALLARIEYPGPAELTRAAEEFGRDILRAFEWNQARTPVWPLADGTWIPPYSGMLYSFGASGETIPGEDGNRSWCYDVELGSHHLIPLGLIDARSAQADGIINHMEDHWFLHTGMGDYPEERNRADWFNLGGFSKVQPYYTRNAEICAMRDDVKPFIRSYFNAIASLICRENLSFWEHFHNMGAWNKTHETGWFLVQTATMYAFDRNANELWLAPFVPNYWMRDGMQVSVKNLPTQFGPVSYTIRSAVNSGHIEAEIQAPARRTPERLVVRLRHPEEKRIKHVTGAGAARFLLEPEKERVVVTGFGDHITIRAEF